MKLFRSVLFWLHLATGVVAGVVILIMCVTGVALTYEKQMLEWADQRSGSVPLPGDARPLPPETLLAAVVAADPEAAPTGITVRRDPRAPATVNVEGGRPRLVDPYTGTSLGEPSPRLRGFFRTMTDWHRWIALQDTSRATGKAITGAANLGFLFIVLSGLYLWVPRIWNRLQFTQVLWFRRGLASKARDFNWHNVIGVWSAIPLAIVIAGALPISYPWASNLVYRISGEAPPAPPSQQQRGGDDSPKTNVTNGVDGAWIVAQEQIPEWRTMTTRFATAATAPVVISVDEGYGGQPQLRTTFSVDRASGVVTKAENFSNLSAGRRARSWLRFAHTGEFYGLAGQTIAGLVSAGGAVLVYTGIALAFRRLLAWLKRRNAARETFDYQRAA